MMLKTMRGVCKQQIHEVKVLQDEPIIEEVVNILGMVLNQAIASLNAHSMKGFQKVAVSVQRNVIVIQVVGAAIALPSVKVEECGKG